MKRFLVPGTFVLLLLAVTGCDFFRTVAGRPTSSELEAKRVTVALREQAEREAQAREQAVRDSIAAAAKHVSDSAAAETFFRETRVMRIRSRSLPGLRTDDFPYRYCLVLAGFSQPGNGEKFAERLKEAGYEPAVLHYTRGSNTVVGICPTNHFGDLQEAYEKVRTEKFFSRDAWIFIKD
ncbi:MAG: hypothetical protein II851_05125 [Bacteroidales bacterium]|nr:hypothetical protein [Bacteroidales bacterium]